MASHFLTRLLCIFAFVASHALVQSFYVAAPNTIRLGAEETVAVAHDGANSERVNLYIEDYPGRKNRFSNLAFDVRPDKSEIVRIRITPQDLPDAVFTDPSVRNYVALVVQSGAFNKEVIIPVTSKSGYVFVQTDKPIYTPKQSVNIRIIPLTEKTLPSEDEFKLQIRNPQNVIVKEDSFRGRGPNRKAFVSHVYNFPPEPMLGEWAIIALYGTQFQQNSSVKFEVREYVLPTFALRLHTPDVILPDYEEISGTVTAEFVYKQKVQGYATFKFGVRSEVGNIVYFGRTDSIELEDGVAEFRINTAELKDHKDIGWFPQISGNLFIVEATVTDFASGNQEVIVDQNGKFSDSPFVISFNRCLKDFKPGLVSVIEADVNYVNGQPAAGIAVGITGVANGNTPLRITTPETVSDEEGRVTFLIHPEMQHSTVEVTLRTNVPRFGGNQATGTHIQQKFISKNNGYLAIARRSGTTLRPFSVFAEDIFIEPAEISHIYYMVVSRGVILLMNKLPKGNFKSQKVEFQVTYDMAPSFRLIVFAHHRNELIADSLKVDVSDQCAPNAEVVLEPVFPNREPGSNGKIVIRGFKNTLVGLLAVDEAVYALRNKDLLTKSKMFKTIESHDLGCGPGGGSSTNTVMGNAGVVLMTSAFTPPPDLLTVPPCEQKNRRRREIVSEMSQNYTGKERECCRLGLMKHHSDLNCFDRADIVQRFEPDTSTVNCSAAFLECCLSNEGRVTGIKVGLTATANRERIAGEFVDELEFIDVADEADTEKDVLERSDFRETWIFDDKIIGPDNREEIDVSLPHSITTWVIQAVSVSDQFGMCVAEPQSVVAFQNVFLQLNLPYSVVRNEQVEIQAVVFNYGQQRLPVVVYMYGVKDICSGAQEGEKSERKKIYVDPHSANSVSFPIIPLKTGEYNIRVTALSPRGSDVIIKKLNVVAEGSPVEKDIVLKLDPANQQKRKKRHVETEVFSDSIDEGKKLQVTAIKLNIPQDFIPGTESCVISALGDEFGPTVETSVQDPEKLMLLPRGCGEQNMMFLAPTMYTMRYLKVTGKVTRENEEKGYGFIRKGYQSELNYRRSDGSFSAFGERRPASIWLTAFVMKVFCQASELVNIDEAVMCSGLKWLTDSQQPDGSFIDHHPVVHWDMTGGVKGTPSMTAFVLIALQECSCDVQRMELAKARATSFLEAHLGEIRDPLPIAIAAYALQLSNSVLKDVAFGKLQSIEKYDDDMNTLHWETGKGTQDIEVTSYGLLTYLLRNDMIKSNSIVNWLNSKRLASGSFPSTQDTVMALQALSEYAISAQSPGINLVSNITSSNDRHLQRRFAFHDDNALVQQFVKVDKVGGLIFVNTEGHGVGLLSVRLKYNVPTPPEKLCKFDIKINVTEVKEKPKPRQPVQGGGGGNDVFVFLDNDLIRGVGVGQQVIDDDDVEIDIDPRARRPARRNQNLRARIADPQDFRDALVRFKRENKPQKSALVLNLQICVKYLGNIPTGMAIVDTGIFSGFEPERNDLENLVNSKDHFLDKYEITSRSVVIYLEKIPTNNYCFAFRVNRKFIVGNTQMSVVRVYDYYNPEDSCTQFYSPDQNSPMLRKICSNGICQCAEGGCPSKNPFARVIQIEDALADPNEKNQAARDELRRMACNENDYVWKGVPIELNRRAGFLHIRFSIETVLKEGIEKSADLEGETRELLARDNCGSAELTLGQAYIIMGKDGEKYQDEEGNLWYRYLLDRSTSIHKWTTIKSAQSKFLQKAFNFVAKMLPDEGCLD